MCELRKNLNQTANRNEVTITLFRLRKLCLFVIPESPFYHRTFFDLLYERKICHSKHLRTLIYSKARPGSIKIQIQCIETYVRKVYSFIGQNRVQKQPFGARSVIGT